MPVLELANNFRGLKADPSMVTVLAIAGDSLAEVGADKQADREAFTLSKTDPTMCHQKSYICAGDSGIADWGSRYQALTDEFGDNGIFKNICSPDEFSGAFGDLLTNVKDGYLKACEATTPL